MAQMIDARLAKQVSRGRYREALAQAAARVKASKAGPKRADALFDHAYALTLVGKHRQAAVRAEMALAASLEAHGERSERHAATLNLAAEIAAAVEQWELAIVRYEAALAILAKTRTRGAPLARVLLNRGQLLMHTDAPRGTKMLERARKELSAARDESAERLLTAVLTALAKRYGATRGLPHAEKLMRQVLTLREARYGAKHLDVAEARWGLADLARLGGRADEALADYQRAREIYRADPGQWRNPIAQITAKIADLHARAGRLQMARREYQALLRVMGKKHPDAPAVQAVIAEIDGELR